MSVTYLEPFGVNTSANYTFANVLVTANITNNGNVNFIGASNVSLGSNTTVRITGGSSGGVLSTDGSGNLTWSTQVANALVAGTVYTNAQPNITSVGTLVNTTLGSSNSFTGGNLVSATYLGGTLTTAAQPNVTSVGTLITLTSGTHTISANANVSMSGTLSQITGANLISGTYLTGTLTTAAQPNVTSLGSLSALTVSGDATVTGNFTVGGNTTYINVDTFRVKDPIIELGGGVNGAALISNDSKDRGSILHYYVTANTTPVDAFMGWDNSNAEFAFGSNVSVTSEVVTFNSFGNIRANYFIGNGSQLTGITATTGNANYANFAGNIVNAIQSNITSVGTLASLTVTANISSGNANLGNLVTSNYFTGTLTTAAQPNVTSVGTLINTTLGSANSFTGGNLVSATYLTGTLTTTAQPNITSVGTLTTLSSGTHTISANANVSMSGTLSQISGANLISGTYLTGTLTTAIQGNITSVGTLASLGVTATTTSGNFATAGNITASFLVSNVATGTAPLQVTSNTKVTNLNADLLDGYDTATAATANTVVIRDANANINANNISSGTHTLSANANVIMSGSLSQISGPNLVSANYVTTTANGNILMSGTLSQISGANLISGTYLTGTLTTAAQPNITSVGTLVSLGVTGTTTSGNFATAGNITASFLVSNVATGTAPFTVTSTTRVANLNVAYANVSDYSAVSTASTGNYYINMVNALTGNVQEYANASLVANATSGTFYSNNAALTNNLYTKYLTVSSISQESFSTITSATGIVVHNVSNGPTFYHTTPSANFTPNFTNVTVTANTTTVVSLIIVQGATPYMPTATANIQIEGANNTINWLYGIAPTGTTSKIDVVNFSLVRTSSAWTVLGQAATFG